MRAESFVRLNAQTTEGLGITLQLPINPTDAVIEIGDIRIAWTKTNSLF
jgi:hypothetical protein